MGALGLHDTVIDDVGDYPSPTVLINGVDVMTGRTDDLRGRARRLNLPTREHLIKALTAYLKVMPGVPRS